MNETNAERGSSGINIRWPVLSNEEFKKALKQAKEGGSPNNISPVIRYSLNDGAIVTWMGDLETDFMESISTAFTPEASHILFAPHHGRKAGAYQRTGWMPLRPILLSWARRPHLT